MVKFLNKLTITIALVASLVSSTPHPHQGKVSPFQAGNPKVKLNGKALSVLQKGKPHQMQIESASGGRGLVVQDVEAPIDLVWGRILDYNNYAKMVPKTVESQNYSVKNHRGGQQTIYTRMKVGFPMLKLQFFIKHEYYPHLNSLTWTLDYTQKSDLDDSCGYWYIEKHPDNANWSRVYYSVEISLFDWIPTFAVNFMSKKALTDATAWVKKFSELEYQKNGGAEATVAVVVPKKKRRGIFGMRRSPESGTEDDQTEPCESEDSSCVATSTKQYDVGVKRYALVSTVFLLSLYNVYLFLSH